MRDAFPKALPPGFPLALGLYSNISLLTSAVFMIRPLGQGVFEVGLPSAIILGCLTLCGLGVPGSGVAWDWAYMMKGPVCPVSDGMPSPASPPLLIILLRM